MKPQRQILVSMGILVDAENGNDPIIDTVGAALREATREVANRFPQCEAADVINLDYLGQEAWNATRCKSCGAWATDADQERQVACITFGHWIDGEFFCTQCRVPSRVKNP